MLLHKFSLLAACLLIATPALSASTTAQAATFSTTEIKQVHHFQQEYADLNKTNYDSSTLYSKTPHLSRKFNAGQITDKYADSQLQYINYYRSLFGLPPVSENKTAQKNAQKTAAVMAAINANPFVNQHGLPTETRPAYVSKSMWKVAQDTSETSNLKVQEEWLVVPFILIYCHLQYLAQMPILATLPQLLVLSLLVAF